MTEDEIADGLDDGTLTVEQAVELFEGDDVLVYSAVPLDRSTADWGDLDEAAVGSTLFHSLTIAGATREQKDHIGAQIVRLRAIGSILI